MASEIRVDKINSLSGVGTVTLSPTGVDIAGITTVATFKVGTGVTASSDGDVFFTGIATGNGSGLTALNASNISSGTVPTARLGSGTASSSTFLRGDSTFAAVTSTTINNNANNRVITGSGTADTLEGEANLQFDGTNIGVGVAPSGVSSYSTIHLKGQTSGNGGAIRLTDYGDTPDSDDFTIYKNSASGYLRINGTDPLIAYLNGADRFKIESDGDTTISTGNLVIGTAGKGIDFSAQTGTSASGSSTSAEVLDHYEEGTWTPSFGNLEAGTTYSTQYGRYCRNGNLVQLTGQITASGGGLGSDGSGVNIQGFPFAGNSSAEACSFSFGRYTSLIPDAKLDDFNNIRFGGNYVMLHEGNNTDISYSECNSSGTIQFHIAYIMNI